jgi:hypothetical protein
MARSFVEAGQTSLASEIGNDLPSAEARNPERIILLKLIRVTTPYAKSPYQP